MNNNLIKMQKILMRQMKRLDDLNEKSENKQEEISRANALSQSATTFLKSINIGLRVIEVSKKYEVARNELSRELGIKDEE